MALTSMKLEAYHYVLLVIISIHTSLVLHSLLRNSFMAVFALLQILCSLRICLLLMLLTVFLVCMSTYLKLV